jgi:hypothetical protein
MNAKTLFLLTLCGPLVACDLFDTEQGSTSGADTDAGSAGEGPSAEESSGGEPDAEASSGEESSGGESSGEESSGGTPPTPGEIPAGLVDTWHLGTEGVHEEILDLFSNGTYQEEREGQAMEGDCLIRYNLQLSGDYAVVGDTLHMQPTTSHLFYDECGTVSESENLPPEGVFDFQLGADAYGDTLLLTPQDGGDPLLYHRLFPD